MKVRAPGERVEPHRARGEVEQRSQRVDAHRKRVEAEQKALRKSITEATGVSYQEVLTRAVEEKRQVEELAKGLGAEVFVSSERAAKKARKEAAPKQAAPDATPGASRRDRASAHAAQVGSGDKAAARRFTFFGATGGKKKKP
jgi:hypothetical protein